LDRIIKVAVVCKLMPLYRLGLFQKLSDHHDNIEFFLFGDTKEQGGIKNIDWKYSKSNPRGTLNWIKTKNYFYKPELLLWQTGIIRRILFSNLKVFIFEGAASHFPIWIFALLCKLMGKKVFFWTHGFKEIDKGVKNQIRIIFFKYLPDALLLYGNMQKDLMITQGFDSNRLFVIYNSLQTELQFKIQNEIDYSFINNEKKRLFRIPEAFTLIFIGRLVRSKDVVQILVLIKKFQDNGIPINCILIGDGPEKESLWKYCNDNNLKDNVFFAGEIYEEENIANYIKMADMMISPGNVGLNCIHSLTYGVPVITHNNFKYQNPEVEAISENITGIFFNYKDYDDMYQKLKTWIYEKDKKDVRSKCYEIIKKNYNSNNQANAIINSVEYIVEK
jgi:glycosyltransferase involved in cell wall biosynthesis